VNHIELTASVDVALLAFRVTLGVMILLHGYNHLFGPGGVAGTGRWFASLGFRPARMHALMSGLVELAVGSGLVLGLVTALACAGLIGTMAVAGWTAHRPNGFFIFRDGYEYVLVVAVAALMLATVGPGTLSLDKVVGLVDYDSHRMGLRGVAGAVVAGGGGLLGAALLLGVGWRPARKPASTVSSSASSPVGS
jgi:putative oxidoreductase